MNRPVPSRSNDLRQSLSVVLISLIDLHLKGGACMSCIETNDFAFQITEFMHEPRRIERIATEYRLPKEEARSFRPLKV